MFHEKYGEYARVLQMGELSMELCGGTHVRRTGDIGAVVILLETGTAANTRRIEAAVAVTRVWFRSLDAPECEEYVATGEPLDKAGAYGIQGLGAVLVERIDGEYFNVMGLPVQLLLTLLERHGLRSAYGRLEAD